MGLALSMPRVEGWTRWARLHLQSGQGFDSASGHLDRGARQVRLAAAPTKAAAATQARKRRRLAIRGRLETELAPAGSMPFVMQLHVPLDALYAQVYIPP